jgi:protoheme IX farnesyltransferase|tara:strand:+ start:828 stop:1757 length:930 start_codon:yes stop_codon:yes gene_type:complete
MGAIINTEEISASQVNSQPAWSDYLELCKPRVVALMLICAAVGMALASSNIPSPELIIATLVGVALVAGSAAVVNHIADARIDALMARTQNRPIATGRVSSQGAISLSIITGGLGFAILWFAVNPLTAWLNFASWAGYGFVYTYFLKRATSQNIVIGGLFGAAPPLFGWTAVTNSIDPQGLLLVLIIFIWTPPHFWSLALERKEEYALVNVPMLPVTHGESFTRLQILLYTILLLVISLVPFLIGMFGYLYFFSALLLGLVFLFWTIRLMKPSNTDAPMATFKFSILYLALLFGAMLVDHYLYSFGFTN